MIHELNKGPTNINSTGPATQFSCSPFTVKVKHCASKSLSCGAAEGGYNQFAFAEDLGPKHLALAPSRL